LGSASARFFAKLKRISFEMREYELDPCTSSNCKEMAVGQMSDVGSDAGSDGSHNTK
jgi:hypothetical protein